MTDAEKLFNDVFLRTISGWGAILSFRLMAEKGLPAAVRDYEREAREFFKREGSRPDSFIKGGPLSPDLLSMMTTEITKLTAQQATASVDAASLIFVHSILDGAAIDYCRVTAMFVPEEWLPAVKDRKVSLADVKSSSADVLLKRHVEKHLDQLERESVIAKIQAIYRICPPSRECTEAADYKYDPTRVERLDRMRHDIIHGSALGQPIPNVFEELDYLVRTAIHLMTLVNSRFGLKLDPAYALRSSRRRDEKNNA